ncbi:MAG: glutamate ABC transporter substrate-binding protein [Nocardiopsis sp. BM-2018]|uniref:Glutamate transport system substrate-binding protein n=1 Tax=Nocardiopsis metallicus TaxID=179819 RepID=A0A840WG51_9ACTN|nr:glutamate ABC transporter substrate-binding protein [Nocardiopsis metallicus]MBB5494423.1 glutamate transport system substrate-binding protein [Nocardiopsis metallicus]QRN81436.1 MAG: glutamate ABC transporter substrate-binding protein [Nocardiopsis sp. BM-2018]
MWFRHRRGAAAAALGAVAVMLLPACSAEREESLVDADSLTIGVKDDQPGLGLDVNGELVGFDVDVANYIAAHLGIEDVELVGITSAEREEKLVSGEVDMVVATYSITPARKTEVTFGGPYYVAKQDILVRAEEDAVDGVRDLEGRSVCQGAGSNSAFRITDGLGIDVLELQEAETYSVCIERLSEGSVDAVSTDNLILAGFLAEDPDSFRFVNNPFTDEKYGVGLPHGDVAACEAVNKAVSEMYQDGTAVDLLEEWFGETDLEVVRSVPQFEGCG